ncbi:MAG: hypothetical protein E7K03_05555 [Clostridium perfringens]|nr:hypothetical protein [Clostridium perfringens]DAL65973.1 MAG TPA_asm: hypothetical protein [Caudoviricetes sp.]
MKFTNIKEIKKYFNYLDEDINGLRLKIIKERNLYHPDKTGGDFLDENQKEKYFICQEAIDFVENYKLEYIDQKSDIEKIIEQNQILIEKQNKAKIMEQNLRSYNNSMKSSCDKVIARYKLRYNIPKITSSGVLGILTFVLAFPKSIENNIFFKDLLLEPNVKFSIALIWVYILVITVLLWYIAWRKENRLKEFVDYLSMEGVQNNLFSNFIKDKLQDKSRFTKEDFVVYAMNEISYRKRFKGINSMEFHDIFYNIAGIIFAKAEDKEIIEQINTKSLIDEYVVL